MQLSKAKLWPLVRVLLMGSYMRCYPFKFNLIVYAILILLVGCQNSSPNGPIAAPVSNQSAERSGGAQDGGGGGGISLSSEAEVIKAIMEARDFLISPKGLRFIDVYVRQDVVELNNIQTRNKLIAALEEILRPATSEYKTLRSYLLKTQLKFFTSDTFEDNCSKGTKKPYPDAYVAELKNDSSVCFNIQKIRRLSPESLFQNMVVLWMHEIVHLGGFGEDIAESVESITESTISRINGTDMGAIADSYAAIILKMMLRSWDTYTLLPEDRSKGRPLATAEAVLLGQLKGHLESLKNFNPVIENLDAYLALQSDTDPVEPKVKAVVQHYKSNYENINNSISNLAISPTVSRQSKDIVFLIKSS